MTLIRSQPNSRIGCLLRFLQSGESTCLGEADPLRERFLIASLSSGPAPVSVCAISFPVDARGRNTRSHFPGSLQLDVSC